MARRGAEWIAAAVRAAPGAFHLAVSGGTTPRRMFTHLATLALPWERLHLWQVDERVVPADDPARNLGHLVATGLAARARVHPMPVEAGTPADYARALAEVPLDLVHLGLGADGHTASLVPGDPALSNPDPVCWAGPYQGTRRMTLGFSTLRRARAVLFVVTGPEKAEALAGLIGGDPDCVAARLGHPRTHLLTDLPSAGA